MRRRLVVRALAAAAVCSACAAARPPPAALDEPAAREVLRRFVVAVDAGRWDEALALASARWRGAYTPGRLALDHRGAGATARDLTVRVAGQLSAGVPLAVTAGAARLPLGDGTCALLVAEGGGWRVDALDAPER
jgi:hypothetical protein